jgi:hypothetical protein
MLWCELRKMCVGSSKSWTLKRVVQCKLACTSQVLGMCAQTFHASHIYSFECNVHSGLCSRLFPSSLLPRPRNRCTTHPCHSSNITHLTKTCFGCDGTCQCRQVTTVTHPKTSCDFTTFLRQITATIYSKKINLLLLFCSQKRFSRNIVGQNHEFWMTDVGKRHFKKWCIRYNYTLFIWAM